MVDVNVVVEVDVFMVVVVAAVVVVVVLDVVVVDVVEDLKSETGNNALEFEADFSMAFNTFSILSSTSCEIDDPIFALGDDELVTFVRDDASFAILAPQN